MAISRISSPQYGQRFLRSISSVSIAVRFCLLVALSLLLAWFKNRASNCNGATMSHTAVLSSLPAIKTASTVTTIKITRTIMGFSFLGGLSGHSTIHHPPASRLRRD
jgi:hypothetical protein